MRISLVKKEKKRYLPLLLLADEQENMIDHYLERGDLFVLRTEGTAVAACVVTDEGDGLYELKNLAVRPDRLRQGFGRQMIGFLFRHYGGRLRRLRAGTGDSPLTVPFYERCGFRRTGRIPDFFTRHYDHPIVEGGTLLRDMVLLERAADVPALDAATLRQRLAGRIHATDIRETVVQIRGNEALQQVLYELLAHPEPRMANNAAWILTHLKGEELRWLTPCADALADAIVRRRTHVKTGLLLTLLYSLPGHVGLRPDLLDFCLERMNAATEKGGVRALCIKLACDFCLPYPELAAELRANLELMEQEVLPPAVACARRNVLRRLRRTHK